MCRSIKRLRTETGPAPDDEIREAALQFVRKISGFRQPSPANAPAFDAAVDEIARSSEHLLRQLPKKRETPPRADGAAAPPVRQRPVRSRG
jgi:hypothetical protein